MSFDSDRHSLEFAYSKEATFSLRELSHVTTPGTYTAASATIKHSELKIGLAAITEELTKLNFAFDANNDLRPPTAQFQLQIAFDLAVSGAESAGDGPFVLLVCYIDSTGPRSDLGEKEERTVCEMQFVLRRRKADHS